MSVMGRVYRAGRRIAKVGGSTLMRVSLGLLSAATPAWAQPAQVENRLVSVAVPSDTGNGSSSSVSLSSADGRYVVFSSTGQNFVDGLVDLNNTTDVFLHDRVTQTTVLVSRSAASATTTANQASSPTAISANGEWVLFISNATNLVPGVTDSNGTTDAFLYQPSTGTVSLVSRSSSSATTTANSSSTATAISSDGEWVLFSSSATDVVAGVTDSNGTQDVFLHQRSTGVVSLVSRSATSSTITGNGLSLGTTISPDGEWALFFSRANNLVAGFTDGNSSSVSDVFLYQRSTGSMRLVSRSAASATTSADFGAMSAAMSSDGEWVLFNSQATNLAAGVTDSNGLGNDVFLYQRSTGLVSLVSRSAASATTTANGDSGATAMSSDGEWVLFSSSATNLVAGVADSNGTQDVFLYQRSRGAVSLVSRSAASATTTANGASGAAAISSDGEWVLFISQASNLVTGVTDTNNNQDSFLYQRSTGAVSLVSRSSSSATTTANSSSTPTAISADGEWVLFSSQASNVVVGVTDSNGNNQDVFLYRRSTGAVSLVSRSPTSAATTANSASFPTAVSANGEWVLFSSIATDLVPGVTDMNGSSEDVFLYQRSTGAVSLVSRSSSSATATANSSSSPAAISADGEWVLFSSSAADLAGGALDGNGTADVFLARVQAQEIASAAIAAATPDPSQVGQAVSIEVAVTGDSTQPADGQVSVTASTGESCIDTTATAGSGTAALFDCAITFTTVGPRTLTASYSGSTTHAESSSAAEPHAVVTTLSLSPASLPDGVFGVPYSQSVSAVGAGSAPYSYTVASGAPPMGLSLDPASGEISGTPTAAGTYSFEVTASDSSAPAVGGPFVGTRGYTVEIARANQAALTATATPSTIVFGGTSSLGAGGGSGSGAVTYAVTAGGSFCSIVGSTLTGTGVGTCTVTATKAQEANFNATSATVNVTVGRANQAALTATANPSSIAFGGISTLGATGGSGDGALTFAVTAGALNCSVSGTTLAGTGVGICTVTATKTADANFKAASATVEVTVVRANQADLTATATPSSIPLTRIAALAASGGRGSGAVSFAVTAGAANCAISGDTLTGTGVGTCTVVATKAGDAQYNPTSAQTTVVVQAASDLQISKDDGTQYVLPNGTVLYEILVANAGPLDVEGARLRDVLPAGLADALWTCTPLQLASCPQAAGEGDIDQTLRLPVNGALRYLLSARVTAPLGSTVTKTSAIETPPGVIELEPADNSAIDSNLVVPEGLFGNGFERVPVSISVPVSGSDLGR